MGNKRQRLARKQFKVVSGGDAAPTSSPNTELKAEGSTKKSSKHGKKKLLVLKRKIAGFNEIDEDEPESAVSQEQHAKELEVCVHLCRIWLPALDF
jgi:hypothetical protein